MKTTSFMAVGALLLSIVAVRSGPGPEEFGPDKKGFIRDWILLAPIQLASDADGAEAMDKNQLPDEGLLKPKAGDQVTVGGKKFTWKKVKATDNILDLNTILSAQTEKTVGYAVSYVRAEAERKDLQLKMGSNDQGKVYLNGKVLLKTSEPRTLEEDSDVAHNVTLNKGMNVVVFKIFNDGGSDWQGCLRFTDASGKAVTNLVVRLEPQPITEPGMPFTKFKSLGPYPPADCETVVAGDRGVAAKKITTANYLMQYTPRGAEAPEQFQTPLPELQRDFRGLPIKVRHNAKNIVILVCSPDGKFPWLEDASWTLGDRKPQLLTSSVSASRLPALPFSSPGEALA